MIAKFKVVNCPNIKGEVVQLSFAFGVLKLDKALTLSNAQHLRPWECSEAGLSLVNDILSGYSNRFERFHSKKQYNRLSMVLANLLHAGNRKESLIYSRDTSGDRIIVALMDYLAELGLIDSIIQPVNKKGCCSFAIALPELGRLLRVHKARIRLTKDHQPLLLRDKAGKEKSIARLKNYTPKKYGRLIKPVELHNQWWFDNSATLNRKPVIPFLHRVFNQSTELGGRFYGSHQQISSSDRSRILFNGKPTVEIDFSAMHLVILYAWSGVEMIGDPYTINGFERDTTKSIMLRLVNSENISALQATITASSKPSRKKQYSDYKKNRQLFEARLDKGLNAEQPPKPKWFDWHIENIPTDFNAKEFLQSLKQRHSAIANLLGGNDIGLRLQAADSALMNAMLVDLYDRKQPIPVLPVHDSLICRKTNSELIKLTMRHHFKAIFNATIKVK
jgi:hypothetical protein